MTTTQPMTCVFIKSPTAKNPEPTTCGACCFGNLNMCFNHVQEEIKREMESLKKAAKDAEKTTKAAEKTIKDKTNKEKKVKDPNRVKKASSPYIHFCNTKRAELKAAEPELDNKAIVKKLGDMWNEIKEDPEKKAPYVQMEAEDKARYEREMAERSASSGEEESGPTSESDGAKSVAEEVVKEDVARASWASECDEDEHEDEHEAVVEAVVEEPVKPKKLTKKPTKETIKPTNKEQKIKKAVSAYAFYCQEMRECVIKANPNMDKKQVNKELSDMWNALKGNKAEKAVFVNMAKEDKIRYQREMAATSVSLDGPGSDEDDTNIDDA